MATLTRDGARITYDVRGRGTPILFGHSLLCDRSMWEPYIELLSDSYRVITMDYRGHGDSSADRDFTLDDLVGDTVAVLEQERIEHCVVCGLSMGGMVAMRLALQAPDLVSRLLLIDTSSHREHWTNRARYAVLVALYRRYGLLPLLRKRMVQLFLGRTTRQQRPDVVAQFVHMLQAQEPTQLSRAIRCVGWRPELHGVERIRCPTLVLVGQEDRATPVAHSEEIAALIPDATLVKLQRAGHLTPLEVQAEVSDAMLRFLAAPSPIQGSRVAAAPQRAAAATLG